MRPFRYSNRGAMTCKESQFVKETKIVYNSKIDSLLLVYTCLKVDGGSNTGHT